jgi:hypothetical protein
MIRMPWKSRGDSRYQSLGLGEDGVDLAKLQQARCRVLHKDNLWLSFLSLLQKTLGFCSCILLF